MNGGSMVDRMVALWQMNGGSMVDEWSSTIEPPFIYHSGSMVDEWWLYGR